MLTKNEMLTKVKKKWNFFSIHYYSKVISSGGMQTDGLHVRLHKASYEWDGTDMAE